MYFVVCYKFEWYAYDILLTRINEAKKDVKDRTTIIYYKCIEVGKYLSKIVFTPNY